MWLEQYQITKCLLFAMAVLFKGMTTEEISHMTMKMVQTGQQFDLSAIRGIKVDKHSTGGVETR